jgi:hypothetical protein
MARSVGIFIAGFAITGFVALCSASVAPLAAAQRVPAGLPPSAALLLRYDANHDGVVTREEMEAGLKADFAAADANHDGCLDPAEVRAENERRLTRDGEQASPLVDWNLDGCVDMKEFGNTVRSYFDLADRLKNGRVTLVELRGPSMPMAAPTAKSETDNGGKNKDSSSSRGSSGPGAGAGGY